MKNLFFIAALLLLTTSCGNKKATSTTQVYELNDLLTQADELIDQTVTVRGFVTHTCKHSGKRCFIVGDDQKTSFRIEAKGNIESFDRELVGSELVVTGMVKEQRLTKEYIDQYEEEVNEKKATEDGSAETCEAELSNIQGMRTWMKDNNKDYYSIYYMDGQDYDVVEE